MNLFIDDSEVEEKLISDVVKSFDKAIITIKGENSGKRGEEIDPITKEIIAIDAITIGVNKAAEIHGVNHSVSSKLHDGINLEKNPEIKTRVLQTRHNIADTATTKLMETLELFNPADVEKPIDKIKSASMLAGIIEKVSSKDNKNGGNEVHLHLYGPKQKHMNDFQVIDV